MTETLMDYDNFIRRMHYRIYIKLWSVQPLTNLVDYLWKLVFLGEGGVGKTSLVGRYVYDSFEGDYLATIGAAMHTKPIKVNDTMCKLVIWDIAGQDSFEQLRKAYYQNASGAFFVFDTTRPETIRRIEEWISALTAVTGKIPIVCLENKIDLESKIDREKLNAVASKLNLKLIQTSAKDDTNVEEAFQEMASEILQRMRAKKISME
jgi:small GTP-binding protein